MSDFELLDDLNFELYGEQFLKHLEEKKMIEVADSQKLTDYERTFAPDYGLRVRDDIVAIGRIFHTTHTGNAWGSYREGFRSFALYVLHMSTRNKHLKTEK